MPSRVTAYPSAINSTSGTKMSRRPDFTHNKILINPNFSQQSDNQAKSNVHINPKFQQKMMESQSSTSSAPKVHINPNFASRPLPQLPASEKPKENKQLYVNPSFLDPSKAKAYDENVKKAIENKKIFLNPKKFQPTATSTSASTWTSTSSSASSAAKAPKVVPEKFSSPGSSSEKENIASVKTLPSAKTLSTTSACKKSLFKKIGTRKLIRVKPGKSGFLKSSHSTCVEKINSPVAMAGSSRFKKIGTNKLVRVKSIGLLTTPPVNSPGRYKLKTNRKIITRTPRSLFSTPFSLKRKRVQTFTAAAASPPKSAPLKNPARMFGARFSNIFSPFRVDRRAPVTPALPSKLATVSERSRSTSASVSIPAPKFPDSGSVFDKKPMPPTKPVRKTPATTLINVQGVRYEVYDNGRKLNRIESKPSDTPKTAAVPDVAAKQPPAEIIPRKLYLDGEEYIEDEDQPGVLIRSRNSMTRQSITSYKNRSINTIIKSATRSKQYCMFFNKFGKCNKRDNGMCPYIHDPSKVAVCRKFLQANCHNEKCLLSHQVAPEKMPTCKFFLQGLCTRDLCPYRHVQVNADAKVCPDFLKGFCPAGDECKLKHFVEKTSENKAAAAAAEIPERAEVVMREKKIAPAKPKRKSICQTPAAMSEKKARVRYYDEPPPAVTAAEDQLDLEDSGTIRLESDRQNMEEPISVPTLINSPSYELKRQRLLRKIELAKQGWSGVAAMEVNKSEPPAATEFLDDSGPYEEIADDYLEKRPPIGRLPSYISLESTQSDALDSGADDHSAVSQMDDDQAGKGEDVDERLI